MVNPFNPGFTPNPFNVPETLKDMGRTMGMGGNQATGQAQPMLNISSLVQKQNANPGSSAFNWQQMLQNNPQAMQYFQGAGPQQLQTIQST